MALSNQEIIKRLLKTDLSNIENLISLLGMANEVREEDAELSRQLAQKVRNTALRLCRTDAQYYDTYNDALLYLASNHKDFDAYMLYIEKNRDAEEQYYLPRRSRLYWLVKKMQRLIDDEIDVLSISLPPGTGKLQPLYSKVLTKYGYKEMGDIEIGDVVATGYTGTEYAEVTGVFPQGKKEIYEIELDGGYKCRCGLEHLWYTQKRVSAPEVLTLREMINNYSDYYIPMLFKTPRRIVSVAYIGIEEARCIYVNHPSHLYVTDNGIITHNTTMGEFFISFVMGQNPNTPNLMSSHSGYMTRMFYDAVLNIITSKEYCWRDVFPNVKFESTNAKEETINLGRWQPFKTLTCRPIRASLTGVTRCEGFLYVDDLVSGIEEALSKDRLDKLYGEYTTDLKSRKKKNAKEIHIATRWSVHDVIGRLQKQYEDSERAEFIAVPDIDLKTGESNFDYDYDTGFDVAYFNDMAATMDDVTYRCLYKNDPIEREGILYNPDELRRYIGGLPDKEPDAILAICDTKDTGTDYNALCVFYKYGERYYMEDVVYKNIDPRTLDVLNAEMLVKHKVQQAQFESNKEGSRTADKVLEIVREKGGRCSITKKYTTQNKETKIIVNSSWVKEHVYFKDTSEYDAQSDYGKFMSDMSSYTQLGKNKRDDSVDALAMFALFADSLLGARAEVMSRAVLGF